MFIVRGTKKFLDRASGPTASPEDQSTSALGGWFATVLFWRPQIGLFVNGRTLVPFAPGSGVIQRFVDRLPVVMSALGIDPEFAELERRAMNEVRLAKTNNRSVVGVIDEVAYLAGHFADSGQDFLGLSVRLAETPCGPLYASHGSPDRELAAVVAQRRELPGTGSAVDWIGGSQSS